MTRLRARPLTAAAFDPFGDVLEAAGTPDRLINEGRCARYHDLAGLDIETGRAGVSLFVAQLQSMPVEITLLERHPLGSQCFVPMGGARYLVVVAPDAGGIPGAPVAFLARGDQGVNYHRNVWHAVLTPVSGGGLFAVIDRIAAPLRGGQPGSASLTQSSMGSAQPGRVQAIDANLEEYRLDVPVIVAAS
ncbi:MAG: ureidoglycolate lyase [Pseudomonadota bacterium]